MEPEPVQPAPNALKRPSIPLAGSAASRSTYLGWTSDEIAFRLLMVMFGLGVLLVFGGFGHAIATGSSGINSIAGQSISLGFGFIMFGIIGSLRMTGHYAITVAPPQPPNSDNQATNPLSDAQDQFRHAINQLTQNYNLLRKHAGQGFIVAVIVLMVGTIIIFIGALGQTIGLTQANSALSVVGGIITNTISGVGFYLYNANFKRQNEVTDKLHETWRLLLAFREAEKLPDAERTKLASQLILILAGANVGRPRTKKEGK